MQSLPELVDVTTDREQSGLQVNVVDRPRSPASRLGVRIQDIDNALNNAFCAAADLDDLYAPQPVSASSSRSIRDSQRDPSDLSQVYVDGASNSSQVPLSAVGASSRRPWRRW